MTWRKGALVALGIVASGAVATAALYTAYALRLIDKIGANNPIHFILFTIVVGMALTPAIAANPPAGSAIPKALWQAFPSQLQTWLTNRPDLAEFLWAFNVAATKSTVTVLYTIWVAYDAITPQQSQTLGGYFHLVHLCWFGVAAPIIWGFFNGKVAQNKAAATAAKGS